MLEALVFDIHVDSLDRPLGTEAFDPGSAHGESSHQSSTTALGQILSS
jgi:hypothetical protein